MKRRLLILIPLLTFVFLTFTTAVIPPQPAYAASQTGQRSPGFDCPTFDLDWVFCKIMDGMSWTVGILDDFINKQMSVGTDSDQSDPSQIFCSSNSKDNALQSCTGYHNAWSSIRFIALGLMGISAVIILIAQALGMEILDAYTIRKVLPRFLICALAITLSWQLMQFFVTLSNDLAYGVRFLIYEPFSSFPNATFNGGSGFVGTLLSLGALTALGWIGLLSYLATALLAVFIAVLVLVLRQLVIIMLIIVAPLAIVMYIMPNTQRYYKFWWESFSKALLMFAFISALIAIGRVFTSVSALNSTNPIAQLAGASAYFLPYFLIPATFKFAGGALSNIGGMVQNGSKSGFGALKQYRGNVAKKNWSDLKTGNRLRGEDSGFGIGRFNYGNFAKKFNTGTRTAANIKNAGYRPSRWGERMSTAESTRSTEEGMKALEDNEYVKAIRADDDLVEAALLHDNDADVRAELMRRGLTAERADQGTAAIRAARRSMSTPAFDKAMLVASMGTSSGWTPRYETDEYGDDIWRDSGGNRVAEGTAGATRNLLGGSENGAAAFREMVNEKLGNDRQGAIAVLGAGRQQAEAKGRFDLVGGSFTEDAMMLESANPAKQAGRTLSAENMQNRILRNALDGQSRGKISGGHKRSMDALAPAMRDRINESMLGGGGSAPSRETAISQYAALANSLDSAAYSAPEMARTIKSQVLDQTVNLEDLRRTNPDMFQTLVNSGVRMHDGTGFVRRDMTHGEIMEGLRNNEAFGRYRKEWGRGTEAEEAARTRGGGTVGG